MTFEVELKAHLAGDSAITNVVGGRIFPLVAPETATLPRLTYQVIDGTPENSLDGYTSNVTRYSVQIDCWARSFTAAVSLALSVRDRMNVASSTFESVIQSYPLFDDYEDDVKIYRRSISVACWHKE